MFVIVLTWGIESITSKGIVAIYPSGFTPTMFNLCVPAKEVSVV